MACDKYLGSGSVSYPCYLTSGHPGPCAAIELPRTLRIRREWEDQEEGPRAHVKTSSAPGGPSIASALEALGMQGPPKTSVDGLVALEGRESRREHPEERRRRLALEESGGEDVRPIEERLVQRAGGVPTSEMAKVGTHTDERLDPYFPNRTKSEDFLPPPEETPVWERPSWVDSRMEESPVQVTMTAGERIMQILVDVQHGLNEIALIISSDDED